MSNSGQSHPLFELLCQIVGADHVADADFVRRSYTRGPFQTLGGGLRGRVPGIVVRPADTDQVARIMGLANESRTPVVPKGGGGSVAAFPPPHVGHDGNILLDTTRLDRIEIDRESMTVTAQSGAILASVQTEARKRGLHFFAVDVPVHMDTIGGVCSGFLGGGEPSDVATSGPMNAYLLGLTVVLPTGLVVRTGGGPGTNVRQPKTLHREAGSPDMTGLFVGDGGAFGIKTEATYTLHPAPTSYFQVVYEIGSSERMWAAYTRLVETAPFPYTRLLAFREPGDTWHFFVVIRGHSDDEVALRRSIVDDIIAEHGGCGAADGANITRIAKMFSARRLGQQVLQNGSAMTYFGEGLIPRPRTLEYLAALNRLIDTELRDLHIVKRVEFTVPFLRSTTITGVLLYFGDGTTRDAVSETLYKKTFHKLHEILSGEFGGFTEACQGEPAALNASMWSPEYKQFMRTIKSALDPNDILMPSLWKI